MSADVMTITGLKVLVKAIKRQKKSKDNTGCVLLLQVRDEGWSQVALISCHTVSVLIKIQEMDPLHRSGMCKAGRGAPSRSLIGRTKRGKLWALHASCTSTAVHCPRIDIVPDRRQLTVWPQAAMCCQEASRSKVTLKNPHKPEMYPVRVELP